MCVSFNVAALLALSVSITAHGGVAIELRVRKKNTKKIIVKKINRVCYALLLSLSRFCFLSFLGLDLCEGNPRFARVFLFTTVSFSLDDC